MKIYNSQIQKAYKVYTNNNKVKKTNGVSKLGKKDQLQLSSRAVDFQHAMNAYKELPEIREEKVAEIKNRIEKGTYKVDMTKIVDKIFSK